ncbi:isopenicillin N synthase family dioxygenase [Granulicoccus phenolivorans]|uniref:isopenicillin N synthase family dioxygenase n=1 Tax=Granulicoccus phenolivorans TaxID=266854 RepID=UPI0004006E38|nr:2-oxoglutarate and iron-dependent oxygenase domain-containing protein [Granulicoccus phenolivorans]
MTFTTIPSIDLTPLRSGSDPQPVIEALTAAGAEVGFLQVTGHGIDPAVFEAMHAASQRFFAQPEAEKRRVWIGNSTNHRGWVPPGEEFFAGQAPDLKEAYDLSIELPADHPAVGPARMLGPNQWPDLPGFREPVEAWYAATFALGREILGAWSLGLGLAPDRLTRHVNLPPAQLRLLHYPPDPSRQDRPGIGAHTDYEVLTLLRPTAPGLEVLNEQGEWIAVPFDPDAMVINIGDLMEVWTGGRFTATTHRVRRVTQDRYAYPLFFTVDHHTMVSPLPELEDSAATRYPAVPSGEHLWAQTVRTFRYLQGREVPATAPRFGRSESASRATAQR